MQRNRRRPHPALPHRDDAQTKIGADWADRLGGGAISRMCL